jgi:hypothetical protein
MESWDTINKGDVSLFLGQLKGTVLIKNMYVRRLRMRNIIVKGDGSN